MEWSCTDYTCIVPGLWPKLNRLNQTGYGSAAKARCSPAGRSRASCRSAGDMPSSCSELSAGRPSGFPGAGMPPSFSLCRSCPRVGPRGNDMIMFLFLMFYIDSVVFCCVTVSIIPVRIWGWGVPASIHPSGCWSQRKAQKSIAVEETGHVPVG